MLARIKPEEFVTAFHRKVYEKLAELLPQGYDFSLSLFSGEDFTPDETGRIAGIPAKYEEIEINPRTVEDCIRTLKQKPMQDVNIENLSDDEASAFFAQLRQNKR